jgi:hypothetical protein
VESDRKIITETTKWRATENEENEERKKNKVESD